MKKKKMNLTLRRIIETLIIELISSPLIYIFIKLGIISGTRGGYIGCFGTSALIFLILNCRVLYVHFWSLRFNKKKYLTVNLSIWGCLTALSFIGLKLFSKSFYTAVFGYTKPFRQIFYMSAFGSAAIFWGLYLILIILVLIKILYFDWEYKWVLDRRRRRRRRHKNIKAMEEKND